MRERSRGKTFKEFFLKLCGTWRQYNYLLESCPKMQNHIVSLSSRTELKTIKRLIRHDTDDGMRSLQGRLCPVHLA